MTPKSGKAKGRLLQQWVVEQILKHLPFLTTEDVRSTSMGCKGEDILLSPNARMYFPFQIECKSRAALSIYNYIDQAKTHGNHTPIAIVKGNRKAPLLIMEAEHFFKLWGYPDDEDTSS